MTHIIAISGSLRKGSFNTLLLKEAVRLAANTRIELASIADIPLYNGDVEEQDGIPVAVTSLQDKIEQADGLMLASPEYNHGVPGVLKNTLDWLSRPADKIDTVFGRKPLAMMGASMGGFGTVLAQAAWLPTIRTLGLTLWNDQPPFLLSRAHKAFDEQGRFNDAVALKRLQAYVDGFAAFIARK